MTFVPFPDLFGPRAELAPALDQVDEGEEEPADLEPDVTVGHWVTVGWNGIR